MKTKLHVRTYDLWRHLLLDLPGSWKPPGQVGAAAGMMVFPLFLLASPFWWVASSVFSPWGVWTGSGQRAEQREWKMEEIVKYQKAEYEREANELEIKKKRRRVRQKQNDKPNGVKVKKKKKATWGLCTTENEKKIGLNKTFNYFSKLLEDLNVVQFTDKHCLNTEELNRKKNHYSVHYFNTSYIKGLTKWKYYFYS